MSNIKFRSKKSIQKRLKGKRLKHWHAYTSHLAYPKKREHLRKISSSLDKSDWKRLKKIVSLS